MKCPFPLLLAALLLPLAVRADPADVAQPEHMAAGQTGVAWARGISALNFNPAMLADSGGARVAFMPFTVAGVEITSSLVSAADRVNRIVTNGFSAGTLENYIASLQQQGLSNSHDVDALLQLVTQDLPALAAEEQGVVTGMQAQFGFHSAPWGFLIRNHWLSAARAELDTDPARLALFDSGSPGSNTYLVFGAGNDRSGQFTQDGSQQLADEIAEESPLTQNQAEELLWRSEQIGIDTSASTQRRLLLNFAKGFDHVGETVGILDNASGLGLEAFNLTEFALGYAWAPGDGSLAIGASGKIMHGITWLDDVALTDPRLDNNELADNLLELENAKSSWNAGLDLGLRWRPASLLTLGLSGQDLNSPKFKTLIGEDHVIHPRVRGGVAVEPLDSITVAADLDLIEHRSDLLRDGRTRMAGLGANWNPLGGFAMQAGWRKDLSARSGGSVFSLGFSVGTSFLRLGMAAALSDQRSTVDEKSTGPTRLFNTMEAGIHLSWMEAKADAGE